MQGIFLSLHLSPSKPSADEKVAASSCQLMLWCDGASCGFTFFPFYMCVCFHTHLGAPCSCSAGSFLEQQCQPCLKPVSLLALWCFGEHWQQVVKLQQVGKPWAFYDGLRNLWTEAEVLELPCQKLGKTGTLCFHARMVFLPMMRVERFFIVLFVTGKLRLLRNWEQLSKKDV